jgi:hypothetical protein
VEASRKAAAVGGAVFVGMGGARWISAEADERILQTSGTLGLANNASSVAAQQFSATESPATALNIATKAYAGEDISSLLIGKIVKR